MASSPHHVRVRHGKRAIAVLVVLAATVTSTGAQTSPPNFGPEYRRYIKDGAQFNSVGDFGGAEAAYRRAAAICLSRYGKSSPLCGNAMIRLGLEVSNQGRFEEADGIFDAANTLARQSASPFDLPRYLVYRAMDMSNREKLERARRLILVANKRYSVLLKAAIIATGSHDEAAKRGLDAILLEFAHGLFVHAGIASRLGRRKEAKLSKRLAKDIANQIGDASRYLLDGLDATLKTQPPRRQVGQRQIEEQNSQ